MLKIIARVLVQRFDDLFRKMNDYGFNYKDMQHLEYLNDPEVLADLPAERRHLQKMTLMTFAVHE